MILIKYVSSNGFSQFLQPNARTVNYATTAFYDIPSSSSLITMSTELLSASFEIHRK